MKVKGFTITEVLITLVLGVILISILLQFVFSQNLLISKTSAINTTVFNAISLQKDLAKKMRLAECVSSYDDKTITFQNSQNRSTTFIFNDYLKSYFKHNLDSFNYHFDYLNDTLIQKITIYPYDDHSSLPKFQFSKEYNLHLIELHKHETIK